MTMRHPLPGGNVIDHLDFALEVGQDIAHGIIMDAVKKVIDTLDVDPENIEKLVVCGNPIQLSLFQNSEIRDLAYAGKNMQRRLGVENVERGARVFPASELFKFLYSAFSGLNLSIILADATNNLQNITYNQQGVFTNWNHC